MLRKIKKWFIIFVVLFIGILLLVIINDEQKAKNEKAEEVKKDIYINRDIQAFYETEDNKSYLQSGDNVGSQNPLWDTNTSPQDIGGNIEIVYGDITEQGRVYLNDLLELHRMTTEKAKELGMKPLPLSVYLGISLSESKSWVVDIGGIKIPMFVMGQNRGPISLDKYKKGSLYSGDAKGNDINRNATDSVGHFQFDHVDKNPMVDYYNDGDVFTPRNQWLNFTKRFGGKFSQAPSKLKDEQSKFIFASISYNSNPIVVARGSKGVNNLNEKEWVVVNEFFEDLNSSYLLNELVKQKLIETDGKGEIKRLLALIQQPKEKSYVIRFAEGTSSNSNHRYLDPITEVLGRGVVDGSLKDTGGFVSTIENGVVKVKYKIYPQNIRYPHFVVFDKNALNTPILAGMIHAYVRHGFAYQIGKYLALAIDTMLGNSPNTKQASQSPQTNMRSNKPQSSLYYNEFINLQDNNTRNIEDNTLNSYNTVDKDEINNLISQASYDNGIMTGSISEVGWKDGFPLFKQSFKQDASSDAKMTFNGVNTTLAEAGCSIYSLASMLHSIGLGTTPIPNTKEDGLNDDGVIDPREIAKVIDAPIIPSKLEMLGYTVEQLPMNTEQDIYNMIENVKQGKSYMVNTRVSLPIRALTYDGKEVHRTFTNSGHFVIISNAVDIDGKTYFEVVDSNSGQNKDIDSNRLFYDLDDAIKHNVLGRSSSGGVVPAFRITGIAKPSYEGLQQKINKLVLDKNTLYIKELTPIKVNHIEQSKNNKSDSYEIIIMLDNVNYIKILTNTKPEINTGLYEDIKIHIDDFNYKLGQLINGNYKDYDFDIDNFQK